MKKNLVIAFCFIINIMAMDDPPREYTLPITTEDSPIGGLIQIHATVDDNLLEGQRVAPFTVLELPSTSNNSLVRDKFVRLYRSYLERLEANHPRIQLYRQVGIALNLLDAEGNFIRYANPLPQPATNVIEVEQQIAQQATAEQNRQNDQGDERTWLDSWWTPVLVRRVVMWWQEE